MDTFHYLLYRDGSTYKAKRDNWALESSNSTAETVIQYAINNCPIGGTIGVKGGGSSSFFLLTGAISLVDKSVFITGINGNDFGNAAVFQKNYATAEPLVNMTNTTFTKNGLRNIQVLGNSTVGSTGVKLYKGSGHVMDNVSINLFDTGLEMSSCVGVDIYTPYITGNLTYGLHQTVSGNNTVRFFGGNLSQNPTNYLIDSNAGGDIQFIGTRFEGANSGYVHGVQVEAGANDILFVACSFEKNAQTNPVVIYDNGNNNTYFKCRFDSDIDYTAVQFRSSSRNNSINNCFFQTNVAAKVATILIDSGAVNCSLLHNTKGTNTVGTMTLTDNGTNTRVFGNAQIGAGWEDKLPHIVTLNGGATIGDATNIALATTTGTKIGTATTQKLGFWNVTPIVQPVANPDTSGATLPNVEIEVNQIKATLRSLGLMAP